MREDPDTSSPKGGAGAARGRRRAFVRIALFAAIVVLYGVSVPWYRTTGDPLRLVFGLPDWVFVALCCYVGVAVLNSAAWMLTDVSDGPAPMGDSETATALDGERES